MFEALAHPDRRRILALVKGCGELAAGVIAAEFAFTKPTLSHHLNLLVNAGLLDRERRGQHVFYRINQSVFEETLGALFELLKVGEDP